MKILVDTCVWSLALRRAEVQPDPVVGELRELISELRVQMIGPVRQEILSGIKEVKQFDALRLHLQSFPDFALQPTDYERAAEFYNVCRSRGVQGANTDFLICSISAQYQMPIFTVDNDFKHYQHLLPISLHSPRF
jgi:predicted nucleic acid-binding protein